MATTPSAQQIAITNLYTSLFNRAPDAAGLSFWVQALNNGASLATITQGFLGTPESSAIYPASQTSAQFVTAFYQTVFGRAPDAGGLAFWVNAVNAAGGSGSAAAKALIVSQIDAIVSTPLTTKPAGVTDAEYAQTVADRSTFSNKVVVGVYFALDTKGTDLSLAKQALAGVNASAASVDAGKSLADGVAPTVPTAPVAPRVLVGTAGNDTFDLTHLTIRAGDSIDGLGGADILNYVDSSSTGVTLAATVSNVETINVRNVNTFNASTESLLLQVLLPLANGETFTFAGMTITANGAASIPDIVQALTTGATVNNAAFSGALTGFTVTSSGASLTFTSTVLGNVPNLVVRGSGQSSVSNFTVDGRNSAVVDSVSAASFLGATAFNAVLSSAPVAFTGLNAAQTLGLVGNNAFQTGNLSGTYTDSVVTATVNVAGGTKTGLITVAGLGLTGVTVNSTGLANTLGGLVLGAATTALAINATTDFNAGTITGSALRTVTASGSAANVTLGTLSASSLTSINASGLTAGGVSVTLGATPATTFVGGAGQDIVAIAAGAIITGTLNGAGGTTDTIVFRTGASLTVATAALISGFEVLQVSAAINTTETYDVTQINGLTAYEIGASNGNVLLTNLAPAATVKAVGSVFARLSLGLANASGLSDVVDLTLDNAPSRAIGIDIGITVSSLEAAGVETINIHALGTVNAGAAGTRAHSVTNSSVNTTLSKVSIDGDQAIQFVTGTLATGVALTVDASTATGAVTVVARDATKRVDVTGGSASDTITGGLAGGTITGGGGGDAIALAAGAETLVYKVTNESLLDIVNTAGTAAGKMDVITGFQSGTDKINLSALITAPAGSVVYDKNFTSASELLAQNGSTTFFANNGVLRNLVFAHIGTDTYVVADTNGNGVFDAASDLVIKLVGTSSLQQSDLVYTAQPT